MPGWKQPGPEGLPQKPGGQVQVFPSQCSMTAGPPPPDEMDPTAQALSGEAAATAVRVPAAGLGASVQARPSQCSIRVVRTCPGHRLPVPTAQALAGDSAATASSVPPPARSGLGTLVQARPSQCSIRGSETLVTGLGSCRPPRRWSGRQRPRP